MSLLTSDYDYPLPPELIARHPLPQRDASRMMVLYRDSQRIEHRRFKDFPTFIAAGDLVVLNETKVIPARARSDDGRVGFLFLEAMGENSWKCLVKPGRRMRVGATVRLAGSVGTVSEVLPDGERVIAFESSIDLDVAGRIPLPPYLEREPDLVDAERYQTVYARSQGALAAPTAGLHFTPEILETVPHTFITLHVGLGTFRPVQVENVQEHRMHSERYVVSPEAAERINSASRLVAIGTTTTRVLETLGLPLSPGEGDSSIFIHPPYRFRAVDALFTNFHLPKSTLLMLVSAFAGREFVLRAYEEAVRERYRFFSYGDCMLIV